MKSGNLNLLEPSGPLQACNGTAWMKLLNHKHTAVVIIRLRPSSQRRKNSRLVALNFVILRVSRTNWWSKSDWIQPNLVGLTAMSGYPNTPKLQRKAPFPSLDFNHYKTHTDINPELNYSSYNRFKVSVVLFTGFEKWNLHNVFLTQFTVKSQFWDS